MSILDAIRNRPERDQTEIDRALQDRRDAESAKAKISQKLAIKREQLAEKRQRLGAVTLEAEISGNRAGLDQLEGGIAALEKETERLSLAIQAADQTIIEADRQLHRANLAGHIAAMRRLTNRRAKYANEMAAALSSYVKSFRKLQEIHGLIQSSWPFGSPPFEAGKLGFHDLKGLVETEIARIADVDPLKSDFPPGCLNNPFAGNFHKAVPLVETIERANEFLLEAVATPPHGSTLATPPIDDLAPIEPVSAPIDPDPDENLLSSAPGQSAWAIQATMSNSDKQITIDNRKGV